jgi:primosomal protein N' (replication factor Y) (superfamily II helicase)
MSTEPAPCEKIRHPMSRIASILLPMPLPEAFDYAEPQDMGLGIGDQVAVPLGPRMVHGVVTGLREAAGGNRPLKPVEARLDSPPLPPGTLEFIQWVGRYCVDNPGQPLAMALRGARAAKAKPERRIETTGQLPSRSTAARDKVMTAIAGQEFSPAELSRVAGVSAGVVKGLIDEGVLSVRLVEADSRFTMPDLATPGLPLNPSQDAAAKALQAIVRERAFQVALLDGVTGSGKTEVYLEAVHAALAASSSAQVLVLLPEIALTRAVIARFTERFGAEPGEWHSDVHPNMRRRVWDGVATGRCRVVVGARSALFLPFTDLALIVVDEEHDTSYKQEDGFIYQARDLAVARGKIENASVILASATPSLETLRNAETDRYRWLKLSNRHGRAQLPDIQLVDLRESAPETGRWLSPPLVAAMKETYAAGEQTLLFLNRRGYAPLVLCKACGEKMTAPDTESWLVEHRYTGRLVCHLTGFSMRKPDKCPHCGAIESLVSIGPGVERVEEEARSLFPEARIAVFSSDTLWNGQEARALIQAMEDGQIDILVATQAAAKGHNFPHLTLVGVVDADLGLRGGDLRAAERTYQLLAQATGRAGRRDQPGRALLQTYAPDHAVMQALKAQDRDAFISAEMSERELAGLPPFGRLAAIVASGPDSLALEAFVQGMAQVAPSTDGVQVYGPADAPLGLVRGRRRKRFLIRADRSVDLSAYMAAWRARFRPPGAIRVVIDMDPYSFL